jgi:uncharacterized protein (DUF1501 family)
MKRRNFIKNTGLGAIGTYYVPSFISSLYPTLGDESADKKLIVIQLSGGNDGLNTIIPFENDVYHQQRPTLRIKKNEVLKTNEMLGFNPVMDSFYNLFQDGYVSVVNSVGYPNPNRSHFRSMDIWQTASNANEYLKTGWIGRYLDAYCTQNHAALEIDNQLSLSMQGKEMSGLALTNSNTFYRTLRGNFFDQVIDQAQKTALDEDNLGYLYKTLVKTDQSAAYLKENHSIKKNNFDFPKTSLGRKLATVSQFIRSGISTEVYYVSHNGFDSHAGQRNQQDRLLSQYSEAVNALVKSLEKSGHMNDVLIMTFSEFGRRVEENASKGTDHGKANNLFLISSDLKKPGFYNEGPDLKSLDYGDVSYKIDFRNIYADVLKDWMGKNPNKIIRKSFDSLQIV